MLQISHSEDDLFLTGFTFDEVQTLKVEDFCRGFLAMFVPIEVDYRHMARPHRERVRTHLTCTPFDYPGHPYTMSLAYYFIKESEVHPHVEDFGIMTDINGVDELQYQFHHLQLGNETSSAPHEIADYGLVIELTEVIDGVVPHDEYRDEMDMMSMSQIAKMVQLELTSQLDLFGVCYGDERNRLIHLLKSYLDVFTWSYKDMLGLDPSIIQEHLPILLHARPVKQKLRRLYPHWSLRVKGEIRKQLNVGFISMVEYPKWLANFTPVPKEDGKARFCVDFKDLNKVSPKDDFPLLHIDLLVDSTVGHLMLSFMDGFFGYNQILMALEDMEKTVFITELRLNPKKYTFGVTSGNFWGIWLQYISRFITRLRNICEPIFHLLRKNQPTIWNDDYQPAFEKIKEYFLSPPVLVPPMSRRPLLLYLSVEYLFDKPVLTSRLMRWLVLLTEFDIHYVSQKSIKGSIVTDQLALLPISKGRPIDDDFPEEEFIAMTSLSVETEMGSLRVVLEQQISKIEWAHARFDQLNLSDERRLRAANHVQAYQRKMARAFRKRVKPRPL
ncbi:hypothetical protein CK203_087496 [Vitis vinifera]|uniref:Transposon Ty3-I Gag-Pol polyprotein n=1 Tax=Vitis vinifera TaxID=29760 RepID=A0A438ENA8_VITVI|nr:hypothetical protein CK203_087496 [Vitis vinifera]